MVLGELRAGVRISGATAAAILTGPVLLAWAMRSGVSMDWLLTGQQTAPHPGVPDEGLQEQCAVRDLNPQPAD